MQVLVNEKPKVFSLAMVTNCNPYWYQAVGHEIEVGDFTFCCIAFSNEDERNERFGVNISEVSTGGHVMTIDITYYLDEILSTKEGTLMFYKTVIGEHLKEIVNSPKFPSTLETQRRKVKKLLGETPKPEEFDESMLTTTVSEILN